ncbi:MAG: 6-carboxytetrahydropterin synthase [Prevotellaceae bacterium]|jgi:6-pyruvoyltetrahydropterin/6-carboxytetrahydropterin synthase|nr:6-carboxytetrahydropterin synthase [Prevotellaceae bacterium]
MNRIRITKSFSFEAAHSLTGYDGICRYIHGHSYTLYVTVAGVPTIDNDSPKRGMVIDFGILKEIINKNIIDRFDHCLMLREDSPLSHEIEREYRRVELFDFQPTCENILLYFVEILKNSLPDSVSLLSLKLNETDSSFAEWYSSDQIESSRD